MKKRRHLDNNSNESIECKKEEEIREYLKDKSIVVYASDSFLKEEN